MKIIKYWLALLILRHCSCICTVSFAFTLVVCCIWTLFAFTAELSMRASLFNANLEAVIFYLLKIAFSVIEFCNKCWFCSLQPLLPLSRSSHNLATFWIVCVVSLCSNNRHILLLDRACWVRSRVLKITVLLSFLNFVREPILIQLSLLESRPVRHRFNCSPSCLGYVVDLGLSDGAQPLNFCMFFAQILRITH